MTKQNTNNYIGDNLSGNWTKDILEALQTQQLQSEEARRMQMLRDQPKTQLGLDTANLIGGLLGKYFTPGQETGEVNTEGNRQAGNDFYNDRYQNMSQDIAAQQGNTNWQEAAANEAAQNQYNFGKATDWRKPTSPMVQASQNANTNPMTWNNLSEDDFKKMLWR